MNRVDRTTDPNVMTPTRGKSGVYILLIFSIVGGLVANLKKVTYASEILE